MLDYTGITAYKLAKKLGTSSSVISTIRAGKNKPGFDFLAKLVSKYELINVDYLLTGNGKLLKESDDTPARNAENEGLNYNIHTKPPPQKGTFASQNASPTQALPAKNSKKAPVKPYRNEPENPMIVSESGIIYNMGAPKVITVNERQEENIIYVPVKARAGYLTGYGDPDFIATLPTYRLPGLDNATYRMFETEGPSMAPTITSGDRVIGQWVDSLDNIRENRVHVIVTRNDGIVIKRVQNRIDQRGKIVLKSDTINHRSEFPTYQIDPEDVKEIWYCRLKLSGDFSEPAEIYHRVNDLEADMVEVRQILSQIYPPKPL